MKVIFFGSSHLSTIILRALVSKGIEVPLVITKEPKRKGRGKKKSSTSVGQTANDLSLDLIEIDNPNSIYVEERIKETGANIFVLASYGSILKENIIQIAKYPLNIHPSILPKYRGAAPVARTLMNGEKKTGVTVFIIGTGVDTGDIVRVKDIPILPNEIRTELEERLFKEAIELILSVLMDIEEEKEIQNLSQDNSKASYAPKIKKEECKINWQNKSSKIEGQIRGLAYKPGAFCIFKNKKLKLLRASQTADIYNTGYPGEIIDIKKNIIVKCGEGILEVKEVQLQGRNKMDVKSFINGYHIKKGIMLN
jgi:methionyl-tRNA formyltransferase